ncbi:hypothetical protein HanRHA438_Chr04g0178941 [Helianthus annuus]|nr:hypothetical protein HanRHA438_Chr04g0178941 [Helianthus annuus]
MVIKRLPNSKPPWILEFLFISLSFYLALCLFYICIIVSFAMHCVFFSSILSYTFRHCVIFYDPLCLCTLLRFKIFCRIT